MELLRLFVSSRDQAPSASGGETIFPELNIHIQPNLGTAVYFENTTHEGKVQPKTLHGGAVVKTEGIEKWACNIWIRDKPFVQP